MVCRRVLEKALFLSLIVSIFLQFSIEPINAEIVNETAPIVEQISFGNGTTLLVIDYQNGTIVRGKSTYSPGKGVLRPLEGICDQDLQVELSVLSNTNACIADPELSRDILFGFSYEFTVAPTLYWSFTQELFGIVIARVEFSAGIEFGFGLRLPVRVILSYPDITLPDSNCVLTVTIETIDWTDIDELYLTLKARAHLDVDVIGWHGEYGIGPWFDESRSFETPLGADHPLEFPPIGPFNFADLGVSWLGGVTFGINMIPKFFCNKIEANMTVLGDAELVTSPQLRWNSSGQSIPIQVHTSDIAENGSWSLMLDDFKYILDEAMFEFNVVIDAYGLLSWIPSLPIVETIFSLDLSNMLPDLELGVHAGYPDSMGVNVFVNREQDSFLHDIAVLNINPQVNNVYHGETVDLMITVENQGNTTETFPLFVYGNNLTIGTVLIENLSPGLARMVNLTWDTSNAYPGSWYTLVAEVEWLGNETSYLNNRFFGNPVHIKPLGDVNGDNLVEISDVVSVISVFGSSSLHHRWNSQADFNNDEKIDIVDIAIVVSQYGNSF